MLVNNETLINLARKNVHPITLSMPDLDAATVGCVILAKNGSIYEGVCIHLSCGLGFCAEAAAIANMIKDGETEIRKIVAVTDDSVLSPCGRCREMMVQVNRANLDCEVVLDYAHTVKLKELIPYHWMENMQA
jgi:cytidine deaminase